MELEMEVEGPVPELCPRQEYPPNPEIGPKVHDVRLMGHESEFGFKPFRYMRIQTLPAVASLGGRNMLDRPGLDRVPRPRPVKRRVKTRGRGLAFINLNKLLDNIGHQARLRKEGLRAVVGTNNGIVIFEPAAEILISDSEEENYDPKTPVPRPPARMPVPGAPLRLPAVSRSSLHSSSRYFFKDQGVKKFKALLAAALALDVSLTVRVKYPLTEEHVKSVFCIDGPLAKLNIFEEVVNYSPETIWPEIYKFVAFSLYQRREWERSAYWLSLAHGFLLRAEVMDKQLIYQCRYDENPQIIFGNIGSQTDASIQAKKIDYYIDNFSRQTAFGKNFEGFQEQISQLDPGWTIIELTVGAHVKNRFGSEVTESQTFPLYLTCYLHVPKLGRRVGYLNFIPMLEEHIEERFQEIMYNNSALSMIHKGDADMYWSLRREHNAAMSEFTEILEHSWLAPFGFLLPGSLEDEEQTSGIWDVVEFLVAAYGLSDDKWVLLYKLIENVNSLPPAVRAQLKELVKALLDVDSVQAGIVADLILAKGRDIELSADRHPTILVLDQDIEQYPWDWMPCLRSTDVSRMPSLYAIDAAYHLCPERISSFPAYVRPNRCTFILNPDGSLSGVEERLSAYCRSRPDWKAITRRFPLESEVCFFIQRQDIYLYCGHGSGFAVVPEYMVSRALSKNAVILMGCGSVQPRLESHSSLTHSTVNTYLISGCPSLVGYLWEITDVECDRLTVDLLERWVPGQGPLPKMHSFDSKTTRPIEKSLLTAVRKCRSAATQFMTCAGIVCYGLPVYTKGKASRIPTPQEPDDVPMELEPEVEMLD